MDLIQGREVDELIPFEEGQMLYGASGASEKRLLQIRGAGHNDIFHLGLRDYMKAVKDLADRVERSKGF